MSRRNGSRGSGRRSGGFGALAGIPLAVSLSAGRPLYTADYYSIDGVSGKVAAFIDHSNPARTFAQGTSANQVAIPAAHADVPNGRVCATFTGVERYVSNQAASFWGFAHDGVSTGFAAVTTPTAANNRLFSSRAAGRGFLWGVNNPTNWLAFIGAPAVVLGPGVSATLSVVRQVSLRYVEGGGSPEFTYRITGNAAVTGDSSAAPDPAAPDGTMNLGTNPDGTLPYVGRWWAGAFPPAANVTAMQNVFASMYGVAA